jgi:cell division protein ZapA
VGELSIKITVAQRVYPLVIDEAEEENIRKAAKLLDEIIKEYEGQYAVKDKQDLLAMAALKIATNFVELEDKGAVNISNTLKILEQMVDKTTHVLNK